MTSPFQDALREELRSAAARDLARSRSRGTRRRIGAAVAAAIAAIVGAVAIWAPSPAAAEVEVRIRDGVVEVRLTDLDTTPDEVDKAMREAGLEAKVVGVPVGPSLVGRFVSVLVEADSTARIEQLRSEGSGFGGFKLPAGWPGRLLISFGTKAGPGEMYGTGSDAFARDEPLHCRGVLGVTVTGAAPALDELTVTLLPDGYNGAPIPLGSPEAEPFSGWHIRSARTQSATTVLLMLQPDPLPSTEEPGC